MQNVKFILQGAPNLLCDSAYHPVPDKPDELLSPPGRLNLSKALNKHPRSSFMIEVTSDCMVNAFIPSKARVLIDRSLSARSGDIILAALNGQFMIRTLRKNDSRCWLVPANSQCKEIEVTPVMNMRIWGVVTAVFTDADNVRAYML